MTQSYGQQPDPSQGRGFEAMPPAPQEYTQGPIPRPSTVTAAAVLAYVQAGITAITTLLAVIGLVGGDLSGGALVMTALVAIAQAAGVALLIAGGVQLAAGKGRTLLIVGCLLELAICVYYLIAFLVTPVDDADEQLVNAAKGVMVFIVLFFAAMPTISLVLARGRDATKFLESRRAR